jgi:hypothetical protein
MDTIMSADLDSPGNEDHHYFGAIQPIHLIESMGLDWHQGTAIEYIARCRGKGQRLDIEKAIWVLQRYLAMFNNQTKGSP